MFKQIIWSLTIYQIFEHDIFFLSLGKREKTEIPGHQE